jgi:transposase
MAKRSLEAPPGASDNAPPGASDNALIRVEENHTKKKRRTNPKKSQPIDETLSTRSSSSQQSSPISRSLQTLEAVSTLIEGVPRGFWNSQCMEMSKQLPLLTNTGSAVSHSTSWSGSFKDTGVKQLSFKIHRFVKDQTPNLSMTSFPLYTPFLPEHMNIDFTGEGKKMMTYRLNAKKEMCDVMKQYCGATRYFYNQALGVSKKAKKPDGSPDYSTAYNSNYLRKELVTKSRHAWEFYIPSIIKQEAVNDLAKNRKVALTLLKAGHIKKFDLSFKTKKNNKDYFRLRKDFLKFIVVDGKLGIQVYPKKTVNLIMKNTGCTRDRAKELSIIKTGIQVNGDPPKATSDSTVCYNRNTGLFYLFTPVDCYKPRESEKRLVDFGNKQRRRAVGIDPGVRSFITTFDECGDTIQIDPLDTILIKSEKRIRNIQRRISELKKKKSKWKERDKDRLEILRLCRQKAFIETKTKNRVKDMHFKLGCWLCRTYSTIFLPSFGTKKMVSGDSILRKRTKARMLTLSHYRFRQILILKAKEFGTTLHIIGEEYTTKGCSLCGCLNDNVGGSRTYKCIDPTCGYCSDRDVNGARNILIKGLKETSVR